MVSRIERNIVKEILRECYANNIHPNEDFITYFIKLLLLDPNWGITENLLNSRANVQKLVKFTLSELESKDSVRLLTLKLQFYFMWSLDHINEVVVTSNKTLLNRLAPIREQALISTTNTPADVEKLRKVIVIYAVFLSGLGNPLNDKVYSEGLAAFRSILNEEELNEFVNSTREYKEEQLTEMAKIIAGIRLFNKYCEKGGADIPDLGDLYKTAAKIVREEMNNALIKVMDKVNILTCLFEKCYIMLENFETIFFDYAFAPSKGGREALEIAKDQLIHFRQYELFIKKVFKNLDEIDAKVNKIDEEILILMEKIIAIVRARMAVPVNIIFPLFEQLSDYWTGLQEQVIILARYSTIITNFESYCKTMKIGPSLLDELVALSGIFEDDIQEESFEKKIESENPEVEILEAHEIPNAENIELQFLGFCCWRLIKTKGFLVPGNPNLGIAKYNGAYFVFSSYEAGVYFSQRPAEYLKQLLCLARNKPQLINFLHLHEQLVEVSDIKTLFEEEIKIKKVVDKGIQCEDGYVIPPYKDMTISWNIWDIKRNLLVMANLSKSKTTSTQTVKSHSTNSIRMQTVILKERETQTRLHKSVGVPTPTTFIYGLRGRKDDKHAIITLTRPVEE